MSDAPTHIRLDPSEAWFHHRTERLCSNPHRYTRTCGPEWDELVDAAQTHFRSLSEHREELLSYVVEAFIAYFEEPRDE